ncbi:replication stress response regulator SDE2-like [Myxocyprinus asiaticus]|uniref:replication stress response regulator SDE2-like n=1 Tax=Myxocyprinus asiaticus TaxID=70543 RepID=UPI002222E97F|nr:replication stress response regulator SDE2-like [Myxocyprinus asiaticus]
MELFVISPHLRFTNVTIAAGSTVSNLIDHFTSKEGASFTDFYVKSNGRIFHSNDLLQTGVLYRVEPRLYGGKGGFGSMLRALGAQIEKTTNREACRDLSGRRLRDVNHEKEMAEWLKKQADREAEKEQRRLERIQRKLAEPKHYFTDTNYEQQCHDLSERLEDSVLKGMQASTSGLVQADEGPSRKRPTPTNKQKKAKRKCFWTGVGGLDEMGSSGEGSDDSDSETSPSSSGASCSSDVPKPALLPSTCRSQHRTEPQDQPSSTSSSSSCLAPCTPTDSHGTEEVEREAEKEYTPSRSTEEEKVQMPNPEAQNCPAESSQTQELVEGPLDLLSVSGVEQLESLGLERLKNELMERGMKCGGTLQERAARLFSVKGLIPDQIDPALLAKPSKGKKK